MKKWEYIDARVRVREDKLGRLVLDLKRFAPYAQVLGVDEAFPSAEVELTAAEISALNGLESHRKPAKQYSPRTDVEEGSGVLISQAQRRVLKAIVGGATDVGAVEAATGMNLAHGLQRTLNNLRRKGYIVENKDGTFTVIKGME